MPFVNRYTRQPAPNNRNVVDTARSTLDALTPVAQERNENALRVNGYPVMYYSRLTFGLQCTCSRLTPSTIVAPTGVEIEVEQSKLNKGFPTEPGVSVMNSKGEGTDEYLSSILNGSVVYIDRYGARNNDNPMSGFCNPQRSEPHSPLIKDNNKLIVASDMDDPFADIIEPMDTDAFLNGPGGGAAGADSIFGDTVNANSAQGCGVCLGTSYVGGYTLLNGNRTVIDTQANWSVRNFSLTTDHPKAFTSGGGDAYAEVRLVLPRGTVHVDALRVWNNRTVVDSVVVYVDGEELTETQALGSYCDGGIHTLRFAFSGSEVSFTHIELQLDNAAQPVYVEFSRLSQTENLELPENYDPQNMMISAHVPNVKVYDIVVDTTYERAWKVVSVQNLIDRNRNPYGWESIARLVQRFELASLLWLRRIEHRHTKFAGGEQRKPGELIHNPYADANQTGRR